MKCVNNFGNEIYCHLCSDLVQHNPEKETICIEKRYVANDHEYPPTCYQCVKTMYAHVVREEADAKIDELIGGNIGEGQ